MEPMEKNCDICGTPYIAIRASCKYCSEKCRRIGFNRFEKARREKTRAEREAKKNRVTLTDIAIEARKAGMSYGQYVAEMYKRT